MSLVCTVPLHQQFLFDAATNGNLPAALCALAHGANVNYVSLENDCRTALLEAVDAVSVCGCVWMYVHGNCTFNGVNGKQSEYIFR